MTDPEDLKIIKELETKLGIKFSLASYLRQKPGNHYLIDNQSKKITGLLLNGSKLEKEHLLLIGKLTGLTHLYLPSNQITKIEGLGELVNLGELDLSNNQISEIKGLEKLIDLQELDLSDNQISEIKGLDKLVKLVNLYLSYNQITKIKGLEKLVKLVNLYLENNQISSSPKQSREEICRSKLHPSRQGSCSIEIEPQGKEVIKLENVFQDALGSQKIARIAAEILDNLDSPLETMFGVFGEWGRGKTFLIKQIISELTKKKTRHLYSSVTYSAWKYQDTPANWAYLYECFLEKYLEEFLNSSLKNPLFKFLCAGMFKRQAIFELNSARIHQDWLKYQRGEWFINFLTLIGWIINLPRFLVFVVVAVLIVLGTYSSDLSWDFLRLENIQSKLSWLIAGSGALVWLIQKLGLVGFKDLIKIGSTAQNLIKKYGEIRTFQDKLGVQAEINKEIEILLKTWLKPKKRVVLFIDDLDRCREKGLLELIDSLRVMLDSAEIIERLQIIIAVDQRILKTSIGHKYKDLKLNQQQLTLEYLDKLFLLGINLPALNNQQREKYQDALTIKDRQKIEEEQQQQQQKQQEQSNNSPEKQEEPPTNNPKVELQKIQEKKEDPEEKLNRESLNADELQALREVIESLGKIVPNLTPRQQLVFFYRFQFLRKYLINENLGYWYSDNKKLVIGALAYKTLLVRGLINSKTVGQITKFIDLKIYENTSDFRVQTLREALEIAVAY